MPARNCEDDVYQALRFLGDQGGTLEEVALAASLASKTTRRHLKNLTLARRARVETEQDHPFRRRYYAR